MVITKEVNLPNIAEIEEVNLSSATLLSAAPYLGSYCECVNNEFMLCRHERQDPRPCLGLGEQVTICTLDFFREVKSKCLKQFNQYVECMDKSSGDYCYAKCRTTQGVFDKCMEEKMDFERPHYGYFTRARIHTTTMPAPPAEKPLKFEDPTPHLPDSAPRKAPRFGSRFYWMTE